MSDRTAQEIWEVALGELQIQVSKSNYRTWFEKTSGLSYEENRFAISVPNAFVAEYLDKNQRSLIEKALINHTSPDIQVSFHVNGRHLLDSSEPGALGTARYLPRLNPKYTFD